MKKLFFSLALAAIPIQSLFALSNNVEVACSPELVSKYSCNQCFDAGYLYENQSMPLADSIKNTGGLEADFYQHELVMPSIGNIGAGIVTFNTPVFQTSPAFTTNGLWDNGKGEFYTFFNPGEEFLWIETKPGYDIGFSSINKSLVNDANRASIRDRNFTVVYTIHPRFWNDSLKKYTPLTSLTHVECQSIGAHFCGDGVIESSKEICDDAGENGKVGKCNTSCTGIVPPVVTPACTSLIASPTYGSTPFTTNLVCNGKDLPAGSTYVINCGNGTNAVMNGNAGSCTYINTSSVVSATFKPKCTINGTITSSACETNVGVNPIVIPACIPGSAVGPQLVPLTASSPHLCPSGKAVSGFTSTTVGTTVKYEWACGGSLVGGDCAASYTPGVCLPTVSIKKYANTQDGQIVSDALSLAQGSSFNYKYDVTSNGVIAATGVVVTDTFPQYVTLGTITAPSGWTCNKGTKVSSGTTYATVICSTPSLAANTTISITVGATLAAVIPANTQLRNIVYVCKDGDTPTTKCVPGCIDPVDPTCTPPPPPLDCNPIPSSSNYDPACVITSTPGSGGGGSSHVGKKCVNGIATCASYNTFVACIGDGISPELCYSADAVGLNKCQNQVLNCGGGGGGGGGGGSSGYCGDGVLQSGEECDVVGAAWCSACKVDMTTNPGANPITDLWMTIPVLARTQHLGYTWLDGVPGKVAFSDNRMVLGVGTKAFTLADTVGFGIQTRYRIPIILEANKKLCITSNGSSLNSETLCTTFGNAADLDPTRIQKWQRADGVWFVNIGVGDYQKYNPNPRPPLPIPGEINYAAKLENYNNWTQYTLEKSNSANSITLFRGPTQYPMPSGNMGPTLNSAFFARQVGTDGTISMIACSGTNCSPTAVVELVKLGVRVSSAVVSSVGSSSNRYLEDFLNPGNLFAGFLGSTNGYTSTTSSNSNTTINHTVTLPVIVGGTAGSVSSITDIEKYAVNGNKNVLAVNGNLVIEGCPSNTFVMQGVRTVIVTGDIIIKCNIAYASNDTLSSWAWISKGGSIQVYNGVGSLSTGAVTNLAGIYVALKEGSVGGNITYTGNNTTQTILRVEGSLYGNATPLFNSRLYARANGTYDILTTGTILTYSNRALVSPPPLLSQYLGNYQVQRVIQ